MIKLINKKIGRGIPIYGAIKLRKDESKIYYPSIKCLRSVIKNFKFTSLNNGLNKTIKYYAKNKLVAVILCGGFGTRLSEHTRNIPKPMVKLINPILIEIFRIYIKNGVKNFILSTGYKD